MYSIYRVEPRHLLEGAQTFEGVLALSETLGPGSFEVIVTGDLPKHYCFVINHEDGTYTIDPRQRGSLNVNSSTGLASAEKPVFPPRYEEMFRGMLMGWKPVVRNLLSSGVSKDTVRTALKEVVVYQIKDMGMNAHGEELFFRMITSAINEVVDEEAKGLGTGNKPRAAGENENRSGPQ
jgi:hypothetical protein